jgi:hypothetical protein
MDAEPNRRGQSELKRMDCMLTRWIQRTDRGSGRVRVPRC